MRNGEKEEEKNERSILPIDNEEHYYIFISQPLSHNSTI